MAELYLIPTALPKFANTQDSDPPSPQPSPPVTRGERAGSGGILHAQEFVNSGSTIGITPTVRSDCMNCPPPLGSPRFARGTEGSWFPLQAGGTLRRGLSTAVFCELWLGDWYYTNGAFRLHELPPSFRSDKGTSLEFTVCGARTAFSPSPPAPLPRCGRGEPRADLFGVLKR